MNLMEFFREHGKVALGFSGGVDSSYLLYIAKRLGARVLPVYIKTPFQPGFELEDDWKVAEMVGVELKVVEMDVLGCEEIASNPPDRCYHCKRRIFGRIKEEAQAAGFPVLIDGTNASDDADDRPGMKALEELGVLSPLRLCGLTKPAIRKLAEDAGLPVWHKPAYACLATRIETGERITSESLHRVEEAEAVLRKMGFSDLRVRKRGENAHIELPENELPAALYQRKEILAGLRPYFDKVLLDLEGRKGSE